MKMIKCPDCTKMIERTSIRVHILQCKSYKPNLFENTTKLADHLNCEYLQFLIAEIDMAKQFLQQRVDENKQSQPQPPQNDINHTFSDMTQKIVESQNDQPQFLQDLFTRRSSHKPDLKIIKDKQKPSFGSSEDNLRRIKSQDFMICSNCHKKIDSDHISNLIFIEPCCHVFCLPCISSYIQDQYVLKKGVLECLEKECVKQICSNQARDIIGIQKFEVLQNSLLREIMNIVVCCKCKQEFQFAQGNEQDAPKKDNNGKKIGKKAAQHFAENRFVCPNKACKQQQCKSCKASPYHLGKDCTEHHQFKNSKKCRYCNEALPKGYISTIGIKTFDDICDSVGCKKIAKGACSKILKCRHPCMGFIKEDSCLPCLKESCAPGKVLHGQDQNSFCSICYVEDLKSSPCVMSKCGHIFHYSCLQKRSKIRWLSPRILFNFCMCPLCKEWIVLNDSCPLNTELKKNEKMFEQIKKKALFRLKNEKMDTDKKLTDKDSEFFGKELEFSLAIYAFFECHKCKKPYFGGRKNCADAMGNEGGEGNRQQAQFDPSLLICAQCCPIPTKNCPTHGKEFITFKCKFCCNISQWFCWGNTHFCDVCHKKQLEGVYVSKLSKDKLAKCEGPQKCPSGGSHPQNGEQHNLGCLLCRNYKEHHRQIF